MTRGTIPSVQPHVKVGKVRALAVTGRKRARMAPEVPTIAESGLASYEMASWYGVFAPAGVSAQIVEQLGAAVVRIERMPDVQERLLQVGSEPAPAVRSSSPSAYGATSPNSPRSRASPVHVWSSR